MDNEKINWSEYFGNITVADLSKISQYYKDRKETKIRIPKVYYDVIAARAAANEKSFNQYIIDLIEIDLFAK